MVKFDQWCLMCLDTGAAKRNRERIATGYCNGYWRSLESKISGWKKGTSVPEGVPIEDEICHSKLDKNLSNHYEPPDDA